MLAPLEDVPQSHSQEVDSGTGHQPSGQDFAQSSVPGKGRLFPYHSPSPLHRPGPGGGRAGSGSAAQEAAVRAVQEPQSGGREGAAGTCIVRVPLPAEQPRTPRSTFLAPETARPVALRRVVTGQEESCILINSCIHSFRYPSVIELWQELVHKNMISGIFTVRGSAQTAGLESCLLYLTRHVAWANYLTTLGLSW